MKKTSSHDKSQQPRIEDYGYISDCSSNALVSIDGSIDWCCMPRVDAPSCFSRLLDWHKGGFCQIKPTEAYRSHRSYMAGTLILVTEFKTHSGLVKV